MTGESERTELEKDCLFFLFSAAAAKFLLHAAVNLTTAYGYSRDEFYYLACSDHLAFGYVDQPPLSIFLLKISRLIFGDSLAAIRILPALAGAATVILAGMMARELGGGRFARLLAALCVLMAPLHLGINGYFSMNSFDILVWTAAAYVMILWIKRSDPRSWIWLGLLLGMGLQNKISVLWLGFGLAAGLLLSPQRRCFLTRGPWLAAGISFLVFLPHIIWQVVNGWPTIEFIAGAMGKMLKTSFPAYLGRQILEMHPLSFPIWLTGLAWYLFSRNGRNFRMLGVIYVSVFALLVTSGTARSSYMAPAYPMLFASGAVVWETVLSGRATGRARGLVLAAVILGGIVMSPLALPVLPAPEYIKYAGFLGLEPATDEKSKTGELPHFFADMNGWDEIIASIAQVYADMEPEDPDRWAVFTQNYGVAGAVDFLGRKYGLPSAISGHNNYWLWGPGDPPPANLVIVGGRQEDYNVCGELERVGTTKCTYCRPDENNNPIYVCGDLRIAAQEIWPAVKHYE